MPQVSVTINGRQFRMACENGEEPRLMRLAEDLDARIAGLRGRFGEIGDTRLTVMAALALADELSEVKERLQRLEPELATLQDASVVSARHAHLSSATVDRLFGVGYRVHKRADLSQPGQYSTEETVTRFGTQPTP